MATSTLNINIVALGMELLPPVFDELAKDSLIASLAFAGIFLIMGLAQVLTLCAGDLICFSLQLLATFTTENFMDKAESKNQS
jgi:hypothetical protein